MALLLIASSFTVALLGPTSGFGVPLLYDSAVFLVRQKAPEAVASNSFGRTAFTSLASFRSKWPQYYSAFGVLSNASESLFSSLREEVDRASATERCERYGTSLDPRRAAAGARRIFFGALVADEPMELFEVVAAESWGVYAGIVLVKSSRTQSFAPRQLRFSSDPNVSAAMFGEMFGAPVLVLQSVNENRRVEGLLRENLQRHEILAGWKRLGMEPDDVGLFSDADECFSRDLLRAAQVCNFSMLDYEQSRRCGFAKLTGSTMVFEASPECVTARRSWFHPDMVLGHCIEGTGNLTAPKQEQFSFHEIENCNDGAKMNLSVAYPPFNGWDFRRRCGGRTVSNKESESYSPYSAFHFHIFFSDYHDLRFKYRTYGHPDPHEAEKEPEGLHKDLQLAVRCAKDLADDPDQHFKPCAGRLRERQTIVPDLFP